MNKSLSELESEHEKAIYNTKVMVKRLEVEMKKVDRILLDDMNNMDLEQEPKLTDNSRELKTNLKKEIEKLRRIMKKTKCKCDLCLSYEKEKAKDILNCGCICHTDQTMIGHDSLCCQCPNVPREWAEKVFDKPFDVKGFQKAAKAMQKNELRRI